jgi:hypothetical protein
VESFRRFSGTAGGPNREYFMCKNCLYPLSWIGSGLNQEGLIDASQPRSRGSAQMCGGVSYRGGSGPAWSDECRDKEWSEYQRSRQLWFSFS